MGSIPIGQPGGCATKRTIMTTIFLITISVLAMAALAIGRRLILHKIDFLTRQNVNILMTQAELLAQLQALKSQNEKAKVEITGKIATLETAIANQGQTTPEVDAALADLKQSIQGTDDIVPDAPVEEPAPEEPAA